MIEIVSNLFLADSGLISSLKPTAAIFDLPVMATVSESDPTLTLCVVMTTNPPRANIADEVVVSLRTVDGTGIPKGH